MRNVVVTGCPRADLGEVGALARFGVATTTSPSTDGAFGELLATALHHRGVRGLVTTGGVRDHRGYQEAGP